MKITKESKLLLISPQGDRYIVEANSTFFTKDGQLNLKKLIGKQFGVTILSNIGKEYLVLPPSFADLLGKAGRGPQVVLLKDATLIAAYTGISKGSKIVDAGTGSGWLASYLARIVSPEKLISYEIREDFIKIAKKTFKFLDISNIQIKNKDVYKGISERNLDLITLDLTEPWKIRTLPRALKVGGYVVAYLPQMTQVIKFVSYCEGAGLLVEKVIETIERQWTVSGKVARPKSQMLGHTAFLVFARKVRK